MKNNRFIILLLLALLPTCLWAQDEWTVVHGDCLAEQSVPTHRAGRLKLPAINNQWDASKIYRQLVILINFSDKQFLSEDPQAQYNQILNESGYNERKGPGCMADYFREQSGGLLNLQFDVYGPFDVSQQAQPYENPDSKTRNHGKDSFAEATHKLIEQYPELDFTPYDWNGDGRIEQVVYVYAGQPGNLGATTYGYTWPNTGSMSAITTPDNLIISNYTASGEYWPYSTPISCGFGTICHEYSHSLGLPDIYPTNGWVYSVCDEWDVMDGGNFTNYGWCPPNYTPLEKMLLGWLTPIELTEAASIINLPAVSEGGAIYQIRHSDTEYLLLENRQHTRWDAGTPGHGLLVWYVDYDEAEWRANRPNNRQNDPRFHPVYADGLDYAAWKTKISAEGSNNPYQHSGRMNSRILSTAPYPFEENNALIDEYITNIQESEDGLISFDFMGGASGIKEMNDAKLNRHEYYDLQGRRIEHPVRGQLYLTRKSDGSICKHLYQ